jgi:hypothetical protein
MLPASINQIGYRNLHAKGRQNAPFILLDRDENVYITHVEIENKYQDHKHYITKLCQKSFG